jgi:hypothetical protein
MTLTNVTPTDVPTVTTLIIANVCNKILVNLLVATKVVTE